MSLELCLAQVAEKVFNPFRVAPESNVYTDRDKSSEKKHV